MGEAREGRSKMSSASKKSGKARLRLLSTFFFIAWSVIVLRSMSGMRVVGEGIGKQGGMGFILYPLHKQAHERLAESEHCSFFHS